MDKYNPWCLEFHQHESLPMADYQLLLDYFNLTPAKLTDLWLHGDIDKLQFLKSEMLITKGFLWSFCLPIVSHIASYLSSNPEPVLLGISGLPGSGKSTLGKVLEKAFQLNNITSSVISLDDFYLPSSELNIAMKDNPWNVSRGLPGSHSLEDIQNTIDLFRKSGEVKAPVFDKSLRNGLGDRSGWMSSRSQVLVIEGWFIGCKPLQPCQNINNFVSIDQVLLDEEIIYRSKVQKLLKLYVPIWDQFYKLFHLKAKDFLYTMSWKTEQENNMLLTKGSSLSGKRLKSFIRMITTSIPQNSLQNIEANIIYELNNSRNIISIKTVI